METMQDKKISETLANYRDVQEKRFKLVTKQSKTQRDYNKIQALHEKEDKLFDQLLELGVEPDYFIRK